MNAITTVCNMYDVKFNDDDIKFQKSCVNCEILHICNIHDMFEFMIVASENIYNYHTNEKYYEINIFECENSNFCCDDIHIILDKNYNLIAN